MGGAGVTTAGPLNLTLQAGPASPGEARTAVKLRLAEWELSEFTQYGERRLWDELEDAFEWWVRHDGPGVDRFGLTVTAEGDRLWLDEPTRLV
ncbi:methyltransferase%2C ATP-grasp peptide maturase system [Mycobacterium tuberculosis]|nr:methyltransferase%2C ATP-grasp peptide maturase system [Mycobacterium tuberculosis]